MPVIIHHKRPSLENGQQREKEGWKILYQLGRPYRIREDVWAGAYKLEQLTGKEIPNTWNMSHLNFTSARILIVPNTCNPGCTLFP